MGRATTFRRKKKLPRVKEESEEPNEDDLRHSSPMLQLATVPSGQMEEWSCLGTHTCNHVWTVHSSNSQPITPIAETSNDDDGGDDDYEIDDEEGEDEEEEPEDITQLNKLAKEPYVLLSHGLRGEAELIRMLFIVVNEPFEDREVLADERDVVLENTPYKALPVITKGAYSWGGAEALPRMLARKFCLLGQTNHEHLVVEAVFERLCRLKRKHATVVSSLAKEVKNTDTAEWIAHQLRYVILPPAMAEWDKLLLASKGPFVVACGMTLADIAITDFLDQCTAKIPLDPLLADLDALSDMLMLVKQNPNLIIYLDDRSDFDWDIT